VGGLRQTKLRGLAKVDWAFTLAAAASGTAGRLVGQIFIHKGDDSGFVAEREWLLQQPARAVTLSSAARDVDLSGFGVLRICLNGRSVFELDHPQKHRRIGDARR
jgi:hypothetical protein